MTNPETNKRTRTAVVAIGGNSLIKDKEHQTVQDQWVAARETTAHIAGMVAQGWNVVITHGNGPQVGFILRRSELARHELHEIPLDVCGADTQGAIGYALQQSLYNEFLTHQIDRPVASVVTQVEVDAKDPAFLSPSKPIGSFMDQSTAAQRRQSDGWDVIEDAGRGWRRVVAAPIPRRIVELDAIRSLIDGGFIVIAVGGGGIPVVQKEDGELQGVAAVIDKDRASSLLAQGLDADLLLISTAVEHVALHYGHRDQIDLSSMTLEEAKAYMDAGHFAPGSMKPKIEAIIEFLEKNPEGQALITNPQNIERALAGETGTWIGDKVGSEE